MKKVQLVLLSLVMVITVTCPVFAFQNCEQKKNEYCIKAHNDGTYLVDNNSNYRVLAYAEYDDYYCTPNESAFFLKNSNDTFVEVDRIRLNLGDTDLEERLHYYHINDAVISDILYYSLSSSERNATYIEFFVTSNRDNPEITWTTTYIGNKAFHHETYHYIGASSGYQFLAKDNKTSYDILSNMTNISISTAGIFNQGFSIIGTGISVLQAFLNDYNLTPFYGNSGNYVQADLESDIYDKYTYYETLGTYMLSYITQKVVINSIEERTHLNTSQGGKTSTRVYYPGNVFKTLYFDNPDLQAYNYYINGYGTGVESVAARVQIGSYTKTVLFR